MSTIGEAKIIECVPGFNEDKSISDIVRKSKKYAEQVIVYDDSSKDDTYEVAMSAGATVIRNQENNWSGVAIRSLFQAAKEQEADFMVTLDSVDQHNPDEVPYLIERLKQDFDIVIGTRFLRSDDEEKVPRFRSFGTETLLRTNEKKLSIAGVPIKINYYIENTSAHNPIRHGIEVLYSVFQLICLRHPTAFYEVPGIALLGIAAYSPRNALHFSITGYVSTNMILIAIGIAVVGMVLLATDAILYTLIAFFKGKMNY